jgi:polar amino acid transport system substrate-binding protein
MNIKFLTLPITALAALLASTPRIAQANQPIPTVHPGRLTIAYRTDDKPISFIANGKPSGFLVAFEQAIGQQLGLKVEFVSTDFASMLPSVKNHVYDSAAFPVLVTPPRRKIVDFTTPIGYAEARLVSRKDAPIPKIDGAAKKTIAVTQGSALIPLLQRIAPGVKVKQFPNIAASTNALLAHQVDGLFTGLATADHLVAQHHGLSESQIVNSGEAAFPVAKSNPKLRAALNTAIATLMKNGTYTTLFEKWNPSNVTIPNALYARYPGMPHEHGTQK